MDNNVGIENFSGSVMKAIVLIHSGTPFPPSPNSTGQIVIAAKNVQPNTKLTGTAILSPKNPLDYWACAVLFEGNSTPFIFFGSLDLPFYIFELSEGKGMDFQFNSTGQQTVIVNYDGTHEAGDVSLESLGLFSNIAYYPMIGYLSGLVQGMVAEETILPQNPNVGMENYSGEMMKAFILIHSGTPFLPSDPNFQGQNVIVRKNLVNGDRTAGLALLTHHDPFDFWACAVIFENNPTPFLFHGGVGEPFYKFDLDEGEGMDFQFNSVGPQEVQINYNGNTNYSTVTLREYEKKIELQPENAIFLPLLGYLNGLVTGMTF